MLIIIATVVFIDIAFMHALSLNTLLLLQFVVVILIHCCYPLSSIIVVIVFVLVSTLILCLMCFIETRTGSGDSLYISSLLFPSLELLRLSLLTAATAIDGSIYISFESFDTIIDWYSLECTHNNNQTETRILTHTLFFLPCCCSTSLFLTEITMVGAGRRIGKE